MDSDFPVEKHLLTRCYTSEERIHEILLTRYAGGEAASVPFLALVPTVSETSTKEDKVEAKLHQNPDRKPRGPRKLNTRNEMRKYIKTTMALQKKAVAKLRFCQSRGLDFSVTELLSRYQIPLFDDYKALNRLWQKYMQDLLFSTKLNFDTVLTYLSSADYNGCLVKVLEARERNIIGIEGIVLFDAQHLFIVVVPQRETSVRTLSAAERIGGLRLLKKRGTLFGFTVDVNEEECVDFTIMGSKMELRASNRTAKKFKSSKVEGIY